jgi:hypothetical protein
MRSSPPYISNNLKGQGIIFYCKDCEKIVDVIPVGRKFVYKCAICKTKNVAFGTEKSIRNYFHLPEESASEQLKKPVPDSPLSDSLNKPVSEVKSENIGASMPIPENK